MKICVLSDEVFGEYSPAQILADHEWKMYLVRKPSLDFIREIAERESYDVYLNLTDGMPDEPDRPGLDVVQALESLDLPFTGADSRFYVPTRDAMQSLAATLDIGFSRGIQVEFDMDVPVEVARAGLRYPLIVKHHNSYGSVGMTRDSRVENSDQLQIQFDAMRNLYGSARVEEFIEGREFSVLVADNPDDLDHPYVYHPLEVIFPAGESFRHFKLKFDADADMDLARVSDSTLADELRRMTAQMFLGLRGVGYGRADIRMDSRGGLFMLEMNSNPSLLNMPDDLTCADYMVEEDEGGVDGFLDRILRSAVLRKSQRRQAREHESFFAVHHYFPEPILKK